MALDSIKEQAERFLQSDGVQHIKEKISDGIESAGEKWQDVKERAGDFMQSDGVQDFKGKAAEGLGRAGEGLQAALPYLLSGGAGAVAGGMLTGRQREEKGEDRSSYLRRILRNAAVAGGLGAGGHYLLNKGVSSTVGGLKKDPALPSTEAVDDPLNSTLKSIAFSPLTAIGAGAAGLKATHNAGEILGHGTPDSFLDEFINRTGNKYTADQLRNVKSPADIADMVGDDAALDVIRRKAGLHSSALRHDGSVGNIIQKLSDVTGKDAETIKGGLSTLTRKYGRTFGQTTPRRIGRGALGLAAAGIPALLGAFLTRETDT